MGNLEKLKEMAVIGAAGKMGSGIALLLLLEIAEQQKGKVGGSDFRLRLIDANEAGLIGLIEYLKSHLKKFAERKIIALREWFKNDLKLIDNEEIVRAFVERILKNVRTGVSLEDVKGAQLIFEAIVEDEDVKADVFKNIDRLCDHQPFFFTNTSSIPIHVLAQKAGIEKRIVGFHFYNPPPVQKLLEIILPNEIEPELETLAADIGKRLHKILVFSRDIAGFIGNGYLVRDIAFAFCQLKKLEKTHSSMEGIQLINQVTSEFLLRPMGIFQLLDYVGLDVYVRIAAVMSKYLPGAHFDEELIKEMVAKNVVGGQYPDGTQKNGFFQYEKDRPVGIHNLRTGQYEPLKRHEAARLGAPPLDFTWKSLVKDPERDKKVAAYLQALAHDPCFGAELAREFLSELRRIANGLVSEGVAHSLKDVDIVLKNGFFHLYGVS